MTKLFWLVIVPIAAWALLGVCVGFGAELGQYFVWKVLMQRGAKVMVRSFNEKMEKKLHIQMQPI